MTAAERRKHTPCEIRHHHNPCPAGAVHAYRIRGRRGSQLRSVRPTAAGHRQKGLLVLLKRLSDAYECNVLHHCTAVTNHLGYGEGKDKAMLHAVQKAKKN